jgi:hypothetical protein
MASGNPSNTSYKVTFTAGQTAPGLYTGTNYKVKAGFQYVYTLFPFSFSITNHNIDFGIITPANPVTRTSTLSVNNKSAGGFIVTATESGQLSSPATGGIIPDTTCDSGTCTEVTAGAWVSSLAYGFGYRCDLVSGTNYCSSDFSTSTYYKQFPDSSKLESPQTIFSSTQTGKNQQALITYKVNVSNSQPAGTYKNVISFIATPTF